MRPTLTAWAEDCIVRGALHIDIAERLTDLVNETGQLELGDVHVEALDEQRGFEVERVTLALDDLCIVELAGPRGNAGRRRGNVRHRIVAEVGPYLVTGTLHSLPGSEPLTTFRRRPQLVPLTEVVIELRSGAAAAGQGRWELAAAGVNQSRITVVREVPADASGEEGWVAGDAGR